MVTNHNVREKMFETEEGKKPFQLKFGYLWLFDFSLALFILTIFDLDGW